MSRLSRRLHCNVLESMTLTNEQSSIVQNPHFNSNCVNYIISIMCYSWFWMHISWHMLLRITMPNGVIHKSQVLHVNALCQGLLVLLTHWFIARDNIKCQCSVYRGMLHKHWTYLNWAQFIWTGANIWLTCIATAPFWHSM